mmetsp:Transcript_15486/g.41586  ORF Transcript_15486/g.41586 Transcript_15486/m.41586 type:complete len:650 (-) Transcript_15486:176-2125(-)
MINSYMQVFQVTMAVLTGTVTLRCVNYHYVNLAPSVMMALSAIFVSLAVLVLARVFASWRLHTTVLEIQRFLMDGFPEMLVNFVLGFLLFAAAVEVDMRSLARVKTTVIALAVVCTFASAVLVGALTYCLARPVFPISLALALVFGAIVSPTDPVAVASILAGKPDLIPNSTRIFVLGESLFNDAIGIVLYSTLLEFAVHPTEPWPQRMLGVAETILQECLGGVIIGLVLAYLAYVLIQSVTEPVLEVTISFVLVGNVQLVCWALGASSPLASVVAGLLIGNHGVAYSFSPEGKTGFHQLWRFVDETLNSLLFFLIGLMTLAIPEAHHNGTHSPLENVVIFTPPGAGAVTLSASKMLFLMVGIVPISLFARAVSVACGLGSILLAEKVLRVPLRHPATKYGPSTVALLTWGGLRGGVSIALTLALVGRHLESTVGRALFGMTYALVLWSILGQGLSFEAACRLIQDASLERMPAIVIASLSRSSFGNRVSPTPSRNSLLSKGSYGSRLEHASNSIVTDAIAHGAIPYSEDDDTELANRVTALYEEARAAAAAAGAEAENGGERAPFLDSGAGPGHFYTSDAFDRAQSLTFDDLPELDPMPAAGEVALSFVKLLFSSRVAALPTRSHRPEKHSDAFPKSASQSESVREQP